MPKCHFIRRRGPIHHPSAHPDKKIRRHLERISQKHKGSMARLAAQRDAFAAPTPRQDRCFTAALIENWCHHLLHNADLYAQTDLLPNIPLPSVQLKKLQPQLSLWKDLKVSNASPSLYTGQNCWPELNSSDGSACTQQLHYDGRSLAWMKKALLHQGAQLHLLTKQKVHIVNLLPNQELESNSFLLSQVRHALSLLSKTKTTIDIALPSPFAPLQRQEIFLKTWQNLQMYSEQAETVRLLISGSDLTDLLSIFSERGALNLDKRSRIFVIISDINPQIQKLFTQRQQICAQFGLAPERLTWLWLQPENNVAIFSCSQGHFHLPIYYRVVPENDNFYICNPLAANYPVLYNKFRGKIAHEGTCSCGFSAPSIELEQS